MIMIAWLISLAVLVSAGPLVSKTVTPDDSCGLVGAGNNKGYTCNPSSLYGGRCCSQNGWCGIR